MNKQKELLEFLIMLLREQGAAGANIRSTKITRTIVGVSAQNRRTIQTDETCGLLLTIQKGKKQGTAFVECGSREQAELAVKKAWESLESAEEKETVISSVCENRRNRLENGEADIAKMISRYEEWMSYVSKSFPSVRFRICKIGHERRETYICDMEGHTAYEADAYYYVDAAASAVGDVFSTSYMGMTCYFRNLKTPFSEILDLNEVMERLEMQLNSSTMGKEEVRGNTVIFAPAVVYMLLFQLTDRVLSDAAILEKNGCWYDKIGLQAADPAVTLTIAPTDPAIVGADLLTENGEAVEDEILLEKGILKGTMLSKEAGEKTGLPFHGNGAENFVMEAGDTSLADLIASVESGILVYRLSGGRPALSGAYSAVVNAGGVIKNGKIVCSCEGLNIEGNLTEVLSCSPQLSRERSGNGQMVLPYLKTSSMKVI